MEEFGRITVFNQNSTADFKYDLYGTGLPSTAEDQFSEGPTLKYIRILRNS